MSDPTFAPATSATTSESPVQRDPSLIESHPVTTRCVTTVFIVLLYVTAVMAV